MTEEACCCIIFRNHNWDVRLTYGNLVVFVKCDNLPDCKTNEIQVAYKPRTIALENKPTTEPGKVPYITQWAMTMDHPYIQHLWNNSRTWHSVNTLFSTKHIAIIIQKITPFIPLRLGLENLLDSEKSKIKSEPEAIYLCLFEIKCIS